jgi:hypothetical protein
MTYKAALAEVAGGGGKAVILKHPGLKRREAFEAYGAIVESLRGRFFTGPDAGVTEDDLAAIRSATRFVACGSSPELGDLNHYTASGVWHGMRACLEFAGLKRARVQRMKSARRFSPRRKSWRLPVTSSRPVPWAASSLPTASASSKLALYAAPPITSSLPPRWRTNWLDAASSTRPTIS